MRNRHSPMLTVELDADGWLTIVDFVNAPNGAIGAPDGHQVAGQGFVNAPPFSTPIDARQHRNHRVCGPNLNRDARAERPRSSSSHLHLAILVRKIVARSHHFDGPVFRVECEPFETEYHR